MLSSVIWGPLAQAQTVVKDFHDWSMGCSNLKTCTAVSISGLNEMGVAARPRGISNDTEMGWLLLEVEAGPNARPKILYSGDYSSSQPTPKEASLRVVGRDGKTLPQGSFTLIPEARGASNLRPEDVDRFIAVAKSGQAVLYSHSPKSSVLSFASLSGFVASMRAIEEVQGRTGTLGAWIDRGKAPQSGIPPAPALPRVHAVSFSKLPARSPIPKLVSTRRADECDDSDRLDPGGNGVEAFNLGKGQTLWAIPCGAGAYNMWSKFYLQTSSTRLEAYAFAFPGQADQDEDSNSLVNVSIDPQAGQISAFAKGRGLADCGRAATYSWDGTKFILTDLVEMTACSGLLPEFWPVRIKSEVIPPANKKRPSDDSP